MSRGCLICSCSGMLISRWWILAGSVPRCTGWRSANCSGGICQTPSASPTWAVVPTWAIALDVLALAEIADPAAEVRGFEAALARLAPGVAEMVLDVGRALPGTNAAIEALAKAGVRQSLLTGNVKAVAEVKLTPFGLTEHLDLDVGAYGDESAVRADLVQPGQGPSPAGLRH